VPAGFGLTVVSRTGTLSGPATRPAHENGAMGTDRLKKHTMPETSESIDPPAAADGVRRLPTAKLAERLRAAVFAIANDMEVRFRAANDDAGDGIEDPAAQRVVDAASQARGVITALGIPAAHMRAWIAHPATYSKALALGLPSNFTDLAPQVLSDSPSEELGKLGDELRSLHAAAFVTLLQVALGWVGEWAYACVKCDGNAKCEQIANSVFNVLTEAQTTRLNEKGGSRLEVQAFMEKLGTSWDGSIGALTFSECHEGPLTEPQQKQLQAFVDVLFDRDSGRLFEGADLRRRVEWITNCHAYFRHEGSGHEGPSFYSVLQARLPNQWSFVGRIPWAVDDAKKPRLAVAAPGTLGWELPGWTMTVQPVHLNWDCAKAWVRWVQNLFADLDEPTCYMQTIHTHWKLLASTFNAEHGDVDDLASVEAQRAAWRYAERSLEDAFTRTIAPMKPFPTRQAFYDKLEWSRTTYYRRLPELRTRRDVIVSEDGPIWATPEAIAALTKSDRPE
jgi:hypothetical protein